MYKLWRLFFLQLDRSKVSDSSSKAGPCASNSLPPITILSLSHTKISKMHKKNVLGYMAKHSIRLKANETTKSKWEASPKKDLVTVS